MSSSIQIETLPSNLHKVAKKLDQDQDGTLDIAELAAAIGDLNSKQKENRNLRRTIAVFAVLSILLVAAIFGASIAAARLSKDIAIGHQNGFAYVKGTDESQVLKTSEALVFGAKAIGTLSNEELNSIKEVYLHHGDIQFVKKGHARDPLTDRVMILVEGGTIIYDGETIVAATGNAKLLLETTYGSDVFVKGSESNRRLANNHNSTRSNYNSVRKVAPATGATYAAKSLPTTTC